jgi:hypothetical protein
MSNGRRHCNKSHRVSAAVQSGRREIMDFAPVFVGEVAGGAKGGNIELGRDGRQAFGIDGDDATALVVVELFAHSDVPVSASRTGGTRRRG